MIRRSIPWILIVLAFSWGCYVCSAPPPRAQVTRLDWAKTHGVALGALHVAQQARDKPEPECDHADLEKDNEQALLGVWCALAYVADRSGGRGSLLPRINPWGSPWEAGDATRCDLCTEGYICNQTRHGADWHREE